MRIEIIRNNSIPPAKRRRWLFYVGVGIGDAAIKVRLESYYEEERQSMRHRKWSPIETYQSRRDVSTSLVALKITREQVPMPPDVIDEIHAIILLNTKIL